MVTAICFLAVYMLADVEEIVDNEVRNPAESTELKTNPNQLRGIHNNNNNYNELAGNNNNNNMQNPNIISDVTLNQSPPITGEEINGFGNSGVGVGDGNNNPMFDGNSNNNFNGGGGGGPMENIYGPGSPVNSFPNDETNTDNNSNPMDRIGEGNVGISSSLDNQETEEFVARPSIENKNEFDPNNMETPLEDESSSSLFREENELTNIDEHRDKDAAVIASEEQWNGSGNQMTPVDSYPNNGDAPPNDENAVLPTTTEEQQMIAEATADEELNSAVRDAKMDIEEAEEELLMKEVETILEDPMTKAEDNMKEVIEYILKDKKYDISKDALQEMENEVDERLVNEVEDELSGKAEKIAEEKEDEIDLVVIEDRNIYPNVVDIENDMKDMHKFFIKDMEREIDTTATAIKETIPQKIENITMEVIEEKTGLHIQEDYLKSTEKKIAKKKKELGEEQQRLKDDGNAPVKKTSSGKKQTKKTLDGDKKNKDKTSKTAKKESSKNTSGTTKKNQISSELATTPELNAEEFMIGDHERNVETISNATREEIADENLDVEGSNE